MLIGCLHPHSQDPAFCTTLQLKELGLKLNTVHDHKRRWPDKDRLAAIMNSLWIAMHASWNSHMPGDWLSRSFMGQQAGWPQTLFLREQSCFLRQVHLLFCFLEDFSLVWDVFSKISGFRFSPKKSSQLDCFKKCFADAFEYSTTIIDMQKGILAKLYTHIINETSHR